MYINRRDGSNIAHQLFFDLLPKLYEQKFEEK